jgi:hypothetical protein
MKPMLVILAALILVAVPGCVRVNLAPLPPWVTGDKPPADVVNPNWP